MKRVLLLTLVVFLVWVPGVEAKPAKLTVRQAERAIERWAYVRADLTPYNEFFATDCQRLSRARVMCAVIASDPSGSQSVQPSEGWSWERLPADDESYYPDIVVTKKRHIRVRGWLG